MVKVIALSIAYCLVCVCGSLVGLVLDLFSFFQPVIVFFPSQVTCPHRWIHRLRCRRCQIGIRRCGLHGVLRQRPLRVPGQSQSLSDPSTASPLPWTHSLIGSSSSTYRLYRLYRLVHLTYFVYIATATSSLCHWHVDLDLTCRLSTLNNYFIHLVY